MVKELRERTGVGMAKCKQALSEAGGDMEKAIDFLRKAGMASAVKKEARATNEGAIAIAESEQAIALVEVNAETDYVAQNEKFKEFLNAVANAVLSTGADSVEALLQQKFANEEKTIDEARVEMVQSIGENIQVSRLEKIEKKSNASYGTYSHMGGKIVCVVEIEGAKDKETLGKDIAMHVAAEAPEYLKPDEIPADVLEREKEIAREQVKNKPENIIEKIIEGKMNAYYEQVCLLNQKYVKDSAMSVAEVVKKAGDNLQLTRFIRWQMGEK